MSTTLSFAKPNLARARGLRDELRTIDEAATKASRDFTAEERSTIESHRTEIAACEGRANTMLEQEERSQQIHDSNAPYLGVLTGGSDEDRPPRSVGGLAPIEFSQDQLRSLHSDLMAGKPSTAEIETRAVTAYPMSDIPMYRLDPVTLLRERTRLAQLMPNQPVETASVTYYTTSTGATAADTVAAGALKPESTPGWTAVDEPIRKIAHRTDVPKEALDDYANFAAIVGREMTAGLYQAESLQLLSGSGTAPDIDGLLNRTGILVYDATAAGAEDTAVSIRKAITLMQADHIDPDVIVLHPDDAELFDLTNYATAGLHANASLSGESTRQAWGLQIVVSNQITTGTAMVANLAESTVLFMREPATVFVDPYSQSSSNLVRFICEERVGLGVTRPEGICSVTFDYTA